LRLIRLRDSLSLFLPLSFIRMRLGASMRLLDCSS
jgi:hypothetical protein